MDKQWKKYVILLATLVSGFWLLKRYYKTRQNGSQTEQPKTVNNNGAVITSPTNNVTVPQVSTQQPTQNDVIQSSSQSGVLKYGNVQGAIQRIENSLRSTMMFNDFVSYERNVNGFNIFQRLPLSFIQSEQNRKIVTNGVKAFLNRIQVAQSMHETDNFKSRLANEQNNFFGMKCPSIRNTTSRGCKNGYADFATLEKSVEDLGLWFNARTLTFRKDLIQALALALYPANTSVPSINRIDNAINIYCDYIKNKTPFTFFEDNLVTYQNGVKAAYRRAYQ